MVLVDGRLPELVEAKVGNLEGPPARHDAVAAPQVAVADDVAVVQENHTLDQVVDETRDEHGLQLHVGVLQDVVEGALGAEVRDEHDLSGLDARPDEAVDVVVPELTHEFHLFHDVAGNVLLLLVVKLLDADDGAPVPCRLTHVGEATRLPAHHAAQALAGGARVQATVSLGRNVSIKCNLYLFLYLFSNHLRGMPIRNGYFDLRPCAPVSYTHLTLPTTPYV